MAVPKIQSLPSFAGFGSPLTLPVVMRPVFQALVTMFLCLPLPMCADSLQTALHGWYVGGSVMHGKILRHTHKFLPTIDGPSRMIELSIARHLRGQKSWQWVHRYPFLGMSASYHALGNDSVIGTAYSLLPFIELPLVGSRSLSTRQQGVALTFRVGTGMACFSRWYDRKVNRENNVIGTRLNNITQFTFTVLWRMTAHATIGLGTSLTHYSSGAVQVPNLGLNIPAARATFVWQPRPYSAQQFFQPVIPPPPSQLVWQIITGLGWYEHYPPEGPTYHTYLAEVAAGKMLRPWNILSVGLQVNFKEGALAFNRHQEIYQSNLFLRSCAAAPFVRSDFLFGNLGIGLAAGYYLYRPTPTQISFYQKIGCYYSHPLTHRPYTHRLSLGVFLTAGDFSADHVSVDVGWKF